MAKLAITKAATRFTLFVPEYIRQYREETLIEQAIIKFDDKNYFIKEACFGNDCAFFGSITLFLPT